MCAPASPGGEKIFRHNLQGKCVSAPPGHEVHLQPEQESIFRTVFAGRVRFGGIFRRSLRVDKILATPMVLCFLNRSQDTTAIACVILFS